MHHPKRSSAHCRCAGPCRCDGKCVGPCPYSTAEDLHVELHTHLDGALNCVDRIQRLEAASLGETDWKLKLPDSLVKMKNKAMEKLKEVKNHLTGKKKTKKGEEDDDQPPPEEPQAQQGAPANMYLVNVRD